MCSVRKSEVWKRDGCFKPLELVIYLRRWLDARETFGLGFSGQAVGSLNILT